MYTAHDTGARCVFCACLGDEERGGPGAAPQHRSRGLQSASFAGSAARPAERHGGARMQRSRCPSTARVGEPTKQAPGQVRTRPGRAFLCPLPEFRSRSSGAARTPCLSFQSSSGTARCEANVHGAAPGTNPWAGRPEAYKVAHAPPRPHPHHARPHRHRRDVVAPEHTAPRVGSGRIAVLATPVMINLIEAAALAAVEHLLPAGHQSLGIRLDVAISRRRRSACA